MLRHIPLLLGAALTGLVLSLTPTDVRADDDYEDYLEDLEDAWEDYYEDQRRFNRRGHFGWQSPSHYPEGYYYYQPYPRFGYPPHPGFGYGEYDPYPRYRYRFGPRLYIRFGTDPYFFGW